MAYLQVELRRLAALKRVEKAEKKAEDLKIEEPVCDIKTQSLSRADDESLTEKGISEAVEESPEMTDNTPETRVKVNIRSCTHGIYY